ncbi:MAG: endo alpha-1,4 polygalactosaminidase, partial [bacterium]
AFDRALDAIHPNPGAAIPHDWVSGSDVFSLTTAVNFLYVLDPGGWPSRAAYLAALGTTNHDVLIADAFDNDQVLLTAANVTALQLKADGAARLAIAYMSIGEAENFRYYWQSSWDNNRPDWMDKPNPEFPDDFKVRYWDPDWQAIVFGNAGSYLEKILAAGFDGVYLDIVDGYEYWEEKFGR